jgi:hypothetical protein
LASTQTHEETDSNERTHEYLEGIDLKNLSFDIPLAILLSLLLKLLRKLMQFFY